MVGTWWKMLGKCWEMVENDEKMMEHGEHMVEKRRGKKVEEWRDRGYNSYNSTKKCWRKNDKQGTR